MNPRPSSTSCLASDAMTSQPMSQTYHCLHVPTRLPAAQRMLGANHGQGSSCRVYQQTPGQLGSRCMHHHHFAHGTAGRVPPTNLRLGPPHPRSSAKVPNCCPGHPGRVWWLQEAGVSDHKVKHCRQPGLVQPGAGYTGACQLTPCRRRLAGAMLAAVKLAQCGLQLLASPAARQSHSQHCCKAVAAMLTESYKGVV